MRKSDKTMKLCKTVHQYNKYPIPQEDMQKLMEIAEDYRAVRNEVYRRYGGIKSLGKLYPGFTVQKEMAKTGLREQRKMPSVYFNIAVLDAVSDIKNQWNRTKERVSKGIHKHPNFNAEEKHYLRLVLKIPNIFDAVLNRQAVTGLKKDIQKKYDEIAAKVDTKRLDNYLRRVVRKKYKRPFAEKSDGFSLSERAYRYEDHGIYITSKEPRKRIFVELTDHNAYLRQITIKLYPQENAIELFVPVDVQMKKHEDYTKEVGLALGMYIMLVTDEGNVYGTQLGEYQIALAEWSRQQAILHAANPQNTGRKKYKRQKQRKTEQLHSYINMQLNQFLCIERPKMVYIPKLPPTTKHYGAKSINHSVNLWQRGYIRKRLLQKCKEHGIEVVEVFGKDISNECSSCGEIGSKKDGMFYCQNCGLQMDEKQNAARNAKSRGQTAS